VGEMEDDSNEKIARLSNQLQGDKENHKDKESESYEVIRRQEGLISKWKHELQKSVEYF
jgi:hypothetical protein